MKWLCRLFSYGWKIPNKVFYPSFNFYCFLQVHIDCRGSQTHPRCPPLQPCPPAPWGGPWGIFSIGGIYNPYSVFRVCLSVSFKPDVSGIPSLKSIQEASRGDVWSLHLSMQKSSSSSPNSFWKSKLLTLSLRMNPDINFGYLQPQSPSFG